MQLQSNCYGEIWGWAPLIYIWFYLESNDLSYDFKIMFFIGDESEGELNFNCGVKFG